ncbi:MAG TPA: porin family protein [Mariprofundaceae bacterium]|nr:porin family protein [Mariprofundaceae bacterium]
MKKHLALIAGILMAGAMMVPAAHAQQPYVGLGLGMFSLDPGGNSNTAMGAYLQVGDDFMPYLGGEVRLGTTDSAGNAKMNWFVGAYAKPKFDVTGDLTIYGLLGLTVARMTYTSATTFISQGKTKTDFSYGLGADYWVGSQYTLGAEWMRYESQADTATKNTSFGGLNVDGFVIDAKYHF